MKHLISKYLSIVMCYVLLIDFIKIFSVQGADIM